MNALTLPSTPTIQVVYTRDNSKGTNYSTIIPNPRSISEAYRVALFTKHIPSKNIVRFEPIAPLRRPRR
jgi:hypothetical protein